MPEECKSLKRTGRNLAVILTVFITTSALGCADSGDGRIGEVAREVHTSADTTVGPLSSEETAVVGPFEVSLTRVEFVTDPQPSPAGVRESVPPGHVLVNINIAFRNPATDRTAPMPSTSTLYLFTEDGATIEASKIGLRRSQPTSSATVSGSGMLFTPVRPGETVVLSPQFLVPSDAGRLALRSIPIDERPRLVVEYAVN